MSYEIEREFFDLLFRKGEGICYGQKKETEVRVDVDKYEPYFSINPLHPTADYENKGSWGGRRCDMNVTAFRNFLFEMDGVELEVQKKILEECGIEFSTIVYSGGKSYHAILSLEQDLMTNPHTQEGIEYYKYIWKRLAAKIDKFGTEFLRLKLPDSGSFLDTTCRNPSRFSRFPNAIRDNGEKQVLIGINSRMNASDFITLLNSCPEVERAKITDFKEPDVAVEDEESFFGACEKGLQTKIKYSFLWAGSEGMHGQLYQLTTWAIDDTGVSKEVFYGILNKYVFPELLKRGYPHYKLAGGRHRAVEQGYAKKGVN